MRKTTVVARLEVIYGTLLRVAVPVVAGQHGRLCGWYVDVGAGSRRWLWAKVFGSRGPRPLSHTEGGAGRPGAAQTGGAVCCKISNSSARR